MSLYSLSELCIVCWGNYIALTLLCSDAEAGVGVTVVGNRQSRGNQYNYLIQTISDLFDFGFIFTRFGHLCWIRIDFALVIALRFLWSRNFFFRFLSFAWKCVINTTCNNLGIVISLLLIYCVFEIGYLILDVKLIFVATLV